MLESIPFITVLSLFALSITIAGVKVIVNTIDRIKYGNVDGHLIFSSRMDSIARWLSKSDLIRRMINDLTLKISVFNAKPYVMNMRYAVLVLIIFAVLIISILVISVIISFPFWYVGLVYTLLITAGISIAFTYITSAANARFLKHMPDTLKILSSRFACINNIVKCIGVSITDFHKSIRGDMIRIYDSMKLNDMERIKQTFNAIDVKYSNEHMTLLLELIWHAYYNGGDDIIKKQFEDMLEDIIEDIENKRDLRAASLSYIGMGIAFCLAIPAVKLFNSGMIGEMSDAFYMSQNGVWLEIAYYAFLIALSFIILMLEKSW